MMSRSLGEMFEDAMGALGGYDPRAERAQQKMASALLLLGAVGVTASTTAVLLWKRGVVQPFLPEPILKQLNQVAHRIAEATEPPRATRLDKSSQHYLTRTYVMTARLFAVSFVGVYAFFKMPHLPLPLSIAGTLVPAALVFLLPKEHVNPKSRNGLITFSAFCFGYTMGPINWVALDLTIHAGVSVLATSVGFAVAAYVTRGKVAYFTFSQVLSSSLAIVGSTSVLRSSLGYTGATTRGRQTIQTANVNAVLSMQLATNLALAVLHSLPTMVRLEKRAAAHAAFKKNNNLPEDEEVVLDGDDAKFGALDAEREAYVLFGVAGYTLWTWFRYAWSAAVRRSLGKKEEASRRTATVELAANATAMPFLFEAAQQHDRVSRFSDIAASVTFLYFYVKAVAMIQSTATVNPTLDRARHFFAAVSPFVFVP